MPYDPNQPHGNYPATAAEVLDPPMRFKPRVLAAMERFKAAKPWRGTIDERKAKFLALHDALNGIYRENVRLDFDIPEDRETPTGNGCFYPTEELIVLEGKLSVITYLHEWAHAIHGPDERYAVRYSLNLYRRFWPRLFERMQFNGHVARAGR